MHRHEVALLVMLIVVVLFMMHYLTWDITTGENHHSKNLGAEKGISVQEAERRLDAKLFLDEIPKWEPHRPHHLFLFQRMFTHAEATGLKEYHNGICRGHQQPSLKRDLWAEASAMEMQILETTHEEVMALYQEVYQLKRNPGEVPCLEDTTEEIQIEILEMLKEHLLHRWGPTQPEETRWITHRMPAEVEFYAQMQVTYNHFSHFWDWQQESWEEALRVVREAHCWVLAAVVMLEGHIEQLNHSVSSGQHQSCGHSGSCQCSGSRQHSRSRGCSWSRRHRSHRGQMAFIAGCPEDTDRRQAALPSPVRPNRWVTFKDPKDTKVKQTSPPTTPDRWNLEATGSQL